MYSSSWCNFGDRWLELEKLSFLVGKAADCFSRMSWHICCSMISLSLWILAPSVLGQRLVDTGAMAKRAPKGHETFKDIHRTILYSMGPPLLDVHSKSKWRIICVKAQTIPSQFGYHLSWWYPVQQSFFDLEFKFSYFLSWVLWTNPSPRVTWQFLPEDPVCHTFLSGWELRLPPSTINA